MRSRTGTAHLQGDGIRPARCTSVLKGLPSKELYCRRLTQTSPVQKCRRFSALRVRAATVDTPKSQADTASAVSILQEAVRSSSMPASRVFNALWQLEKQKLPAESWSENLGSGKGGTKWRLVFLANAKIVSRGSKTGEGGGSYVPLTVVQRWDFGESETENGIYLGQLAAVSLKGPCKYANKKLPFDYTKLNLRLGPKWFDFDIKIPNKQKEGPFFLFFYVDEEIACARGRGGGWAIWQRTTPEWDLKAGVTL